VPLPFLVGLPDGGGDLLGVHPVERMCSSVAGLPVGVVPTAARVGVSGLVAVGVLPVPLSGSLEASQFARLYARQRTPGRCRCRR
jgi:hypothetical protein